jgi:hypothetical protein
MKKAGLTLTLMASLFWTQANTESACGYRNNAFRDSEVVRYYVYYTLAGIWVHAGTVSFTVKLTSLNGKPVYHVVGDGATLDSYDWIYKVRDRYESFIDTVNMQPVKFIRNVNEGGYKKYENITFYQDNNTAVTNKGVFKVPPCVQDVLSEVYLARNIDFNKYKKGDKIPFDLFLDNEVFHMYITYLGKEVVKTKYGKFRCIKFKPLLLKGSIFEGGEKMTVWVSDDPNRIPLRIESPITVGNIKVDMMDYRNLRYPMSSMISVR